MSDTPKPKVRAAVTQSAGRQSVEIDKVEKLIRLMVDNDLASISLRDGDEEIKLSRPNPNGAAHQPTNIPPQFALPAPGDVGPTGAATPANPPAGESAKDDLLTIASPMVGTFYASPSPDVEPFIKIGSKVSATTVVCIIEAMKVFNEIRAEVAGTIEKIVASNQQAVEYGQPLFLVRPD